MKVCHISTLHNAIDIRITRKQLATLAASGIDAYLVAHGDSDEVAQAKAFGVTLIPLSSSKDAGRAKRFTASSFTAFRLARKVGADVYHFHDPELVPVGIALKLLGSKVVIDLHEDLTAEVLEKQWIPQYLRSSVSVFAKYLQWVAAKSFDAVVTATPHISSLFVGKSNRVVTINNYPRLSELQEPKNNGSWASRDKAVYVGGISEIRGIFPMIEAAGKARQSIMLLGMFDSEESANKARSMPGFEYIDEHGFVDRVAVKNKFAGAYAGVCTFLPSPNNINAQPNKLFEYMSAGIPVIASNFPLWKNLITKYQCGICVDPESSTEIAAALTYLRENPEVAEQMGARARLAVERDFNWEAEAERLLELYGQLA